MNRNKQVVWWNHTDIPSGQHPNAKLVVMQCGACGFKYFGQSCDAHLRKCPECQDGAAPNTPA